jgi:hypothetical protein
MENLDISSGLEAIKTYIEDDDYVIKSDNNFFIESFTVNNIMNNSDNTKFIKNVEKIVRTSREYSMYLCTLRTNKQINSCSFFSQLDTESVTLEFHHAPFNLYTIVEVIMFDMLSKNQAITTFTVAREVMKAHFENIVGLVPLTRSIHKLVHKGSIKISPEMVYGDWLKFMRKYARGITEKEIKNIYGFCSITSDVIENFNLNKLQINTDIHKLNDFKTEITPAQYELLKLIPASEVQ